MVSKSENGSLLLVLYYTAIILVLITSAMSCVSEKKLAKLCAEKYPPRDSTVVRDRIITDTINVPGDTIKVDCPPVFIKDTTTGAIIKVPVTKKAPCPPKQILYKTVVRDSLIYRENTALVQHQKNIIALRDKTIEKISDSLRFYKKWFWILVISLVVYVGIRYVIPRYLASR